LNFLKSFVTLAMKLPLNMIRAHFQIRKEMDDKLRLERNSLKSALDASHASELDKAVEAAKKEVERDTKANEKVLKDENDRFQLQIQTLQRDVNALNQKIVDAVNHAVKEGDKKVISRWNIQI
jgi:vacuolar-type H+-ATPase subunit D/Vma8